MATGARAICVFCGSASGARPEYVDAAREAGAAIASRGARVVYGGGGRGLMGALADGALAAGGMVTGVIPHWMVEKEAAHKGVADMRRVGSMLERKTLMAELSDAFLVLAGGLGTMDELFEMLTWSQLGLHGREKPTAVLNTRGFYDHLDAWLARAREDGFIRSSAWSTHESIEAALRALGA